MSAQLIFELEKLEKERDTLRQQLAEVQAGFPDIGQDPLQMEKRDGFDGSYKRLNYANCIQQKGVPDQTALVWRIDIDRVSSELIVQRARGESFRSAMKQVDELKKQLAARDEALKGAA